MADLAIEDRDTILRELFGGVLYLGLARGSVTDEETDPGYRRIAVRLSDPQGTDVRYVENAEAWTFAPYRRDAQQAVDIAMLWTEAGALRWSERLQRARQPLAGDQIIFPPGSFRIGVP